MGSKADQIVPYAETIAMYEIGSQPKSLQTYEGSAHGTDLLKSSAHEHPVKLLLDFVGMAMPLR